MKANRSVLVQFSEIIRPEGGEASAFPPQPDRYSDVAVLQPPYPGVPIRARPNRGTGRRRVS